MSHYNVKPIRLDFKPSKRLAAILAIAAAIACFALAVLSIALWIKLAAMTVAVLATAYHVLHALQRTPRSCIALVLDSKGEWQLTMRDGSRYAATILPSSFVTPYLTILNCRLTGRWLRYAWQRYPWHHYHLVILPDAVDAESFRRLRVWLRWGYQGSSVAAADA